MDYLCGRSPQVRSNAPNKAPVALEDRLQLLGGRPLATSGITVAALAIVSMIGFAMTRTASEPSSAANQRVAFFGYNVEGEDPSGKATTLAKFSTDKMFQSLRTFRLDAAAPTETLETPKDKRFGKAEAVGARYALTGAVRSEGDQSVLTTQIEDVASKTTLWERSFSGPAKEAIYLPAMAAKASNRTLRCIVGWRRPTHETLKFVQMVADLCQDGGYASDDIGPAGEMVSKMRELTHAAPDFSVAHAELAKALAHLSVLSSPSARPPLIAEAEAARTRAIRLDPNDPDLSVDIEIAAAKALPLAEFDEIVRNVVLKTQRTDARRYEHANSAYYGILLNVGRRRKSLDALAATVANDPGQQGGVLGFAYAVRGQSAKARAQFESGLADDPSNDTWIQWLIGAVFLGAGDAEALLKAPPWFVSSGTLECMRDVQRAKVSGDQAVRRRATVRAAECAGRRDLDRQELVLVPSMLGDIDGAFEAMEREPKINSSTVNDPITPNLFWPQTRTMRADPRFLPLMERLGLMDYWRTTKTQPDVCETEDTPFCRELQKTLPTKH